ncbi:MAG: UDP-N-acetylmuramate dehydrogenase [Sulfuricellaceae bacterium]|nr:UDP-N-acetylmuramate dehydrogenase [Sulfuricellaceae bacterium]
MTTTNKLAPRGTLLLNEPMSRHTSWKAGGAAARYYQPADVDDLAMFMRSMAPDEPVSLVGLGSNLLVRDGGLRGTVIGLHGALNALRLEADGTVYAEAGVADAKVARFAARHGLAGAEFLAGIPGTVGGALAMNAGCYGAETWQIVLKVLTISRDGRLRERCAADYDIGYRHVALRASDEEWAMGDGCPHFPHSSSPIPHHPQEWFVAAWFELQQGDGEVSKQRIKALLAQRAASQPLSKPNAGSVFRNPPGDYAARLIENCGLKGLKIGGAEVSAKHANFIVNSGGATAADIEALIERVQAEVRQRCGIELQREVRIVGEKA